MPIYSLYHREMGKRGRETMVLIDGTSVPSSQRAGIVQTYKEKRHQSGLWREAKATCRMLILEVSNSSTLVVSRYDITIIYVYCIGF